MAIFIQAREVFLNTRSLIIKKRIRQLTFEGDSTTYINELALVVFTLIRNTCEWYRDSFKQNEMASRFITWVREQTEIYADIYKRQVFNHSQLNCQIIADCFKSTLDQCSIVSIGITEGKPDHKAAELIGGLYHPIAAQSGSRSQIHARGFLFGQCA